MKAYNRSRADERGVILLLALFIIAIFSILVLEFNYSTRVEYHVASNFRDDLLALSIAKAGIYETIALIRSHRLEEIAEKEKEDEEKGRTPQQEIEALKRDQLKKPTPTQEEIPYPDYYGEEWAKERYMVPFGAGYLTVKVIDESGKININTLVKEIRPPATPTPLQAAQGTAIPGEETGTEEEVKKPPRKWGQKDEDWAAEQAEAQEGEAEIEKPVRYAIDKKVEKDIMRLMEILDIRDVDPEKVTAAIVDWMDSNGEGDWEDDAYGGEKGESAPKNAPLDVLSELLMISGVTGELYFGPNRPEVIDLEAEMARKGAQARHKAGLRDCLTVCSKTKVNVNTAPPEVLNALLEEKNEALVKEIVNYTRKDYFKDLKNFEEEIGEHTPASFTAKIGVGSDSFQIISEGRVNEAKKQIQTFVYIDKDANVKILYWRVEI